MSEFSKKMSKISDQFKQMDNEILSGCVKKKVNRKMQLVSLARWKHLPAPHDVFAFCVKPYEGLWCQASLGGKVFCMAENPCWRKTP